VTLKVLYGEETAFMKKEVFLEVMVPLISVRNSVLIMISTLVDKFNFYTRLLNLRNPATGRKVVNSYVCELVCQTCKMGKHPDKCMHMTHLLPWWKNAGGNTLQSLLYADDKHLMAREALGIIIDGGASWFDKDSVDFLLNVSEIAVSEVTPINWVIVACDPNAGGSGGMAFTATTVYRGYQLVRCVCVRACACVMVTTGDDVFSVVRCARSRRCARRRRAARSATA
jgi:hypothetical protein